LHGRVEAFGAGNVRRRVGIEGQPAGFGGLRCSTPYFA